MHVAFEPLPAAVQAVKDAKLQLLFGNKTYSNFYISEAAYQLRLYIKSSNQKAPSKHGKSE